MCSPSPPPAPDYSGAATAQGAANKETAIASSNLSNPNVIGPTGSQIYTNGPNPGDRPTLTQTLSPEQQALYEQSVKTKGLLGGLGEQGATSLQDIVGKNLDLSGVPQGPGDSAQTRDKVVNAMMSRVDQDTQGQRDQANSDLVAAGIRPGTKAYENKMDQINRGYNDARQQAIIASGGEASRDFGMDTQRRKDAIAEMLTKRQTPLNEVTALMSGSQVNNPFAMPGYSGTNVAPTPIFGATEAAGNYAADMYNAKAAGAAGTQQGLFGLGSAAISKWSDRRLKTNIQKIGVLRPGINLYAYRYKWSPYREVGVMADEVEKVIPEAVSEHLGYKYVNYSMVLS